MASLGFRVGQYLLAAGLVLWVGLLGLRLVTHKPIAAASVYLLAGVTGLVVCGLAVIASFPWSPVPSEGAPGHDEARRGIGLSRGLVWVGAVLLETGILLTLPFTAIRPVGDVVVGLFLGSGALLVLLGLEVMRRVGIRRGPAAVAA